MGDPSYFHRIRPRAHESCDDARRRLGHQVETHRRQREQAKARGLAQGFPGITANTPTDPPFATWDTADVCPIHRFLLAEAGQATNQPREATMIQHHHFHFDKGAPVMAIDPVLHTPTITIADSSNVEPIRLGVYGVNLDVVQRAAEAFNAVMAGATLLPVTMPPTAADAMTDRDPLRLANREKHREAAQAGDEVRAREDVGALS